ncbi:hypothetical protein DMUE_0554 [Dictyocoela muelleri]|nr:hypothetical protein DMUE_0554 [Dictyocoela muelleri]
MSVVSKITQFSGISKNIVSKIKKAFITTIIKYFDENLIHLGGEGRVVHIDETMLNHTVRAHRGRSPRAKTWAITMVDTSTSPGIGYVEIVGARNAETLLPIINRVIMSGSIIHTDEWKAYNDLARNENYTHLKITHKYNFVDPQSGVHT